MKTITVKKLEKLGFEVSKDEFGYNLQQYTPEGEDWNISINELEDLKEYAENFNPEEEFEMWIEAKHNGFEGVPDVPSLWKDQLWKQKLLKKLI